jgi:hypothetical protein
MLSINALYDGEKLGMRKKISIHAPSEVIVTFLDEPSVDKELNITSQIADCGYSFDFLNNSDDDIYSDSDLIVKY